MEERLYTHPLFELARSDTSRVVDRNGASTRWEPFAKILWKLDKICRLHQLPDDHLQDSRSYQHYSTFKFARDRFTEVYLIISHNISYVLVFFCPYLSSFFSRATG